MRFFLLLFIALPLFELWLIIKVGSLLGAAATVALVVATAVVGLLVLRYQGVKTLLRGRESMAQGHLPAQEMLEAMMLSIAGVLLVLPGFATDTAGFLLLVSPLRRLVAARALSRMVVIGSFQSMARRPGNTMEGEFWRHDDPSERRPPGELPDRRGPLR
ncbi:MAG TPA: FxsA family protein [Porticoccaceae bacterium]